MSLSGRLMELGKLFSLILFNDLICTGDAHLKNYAVIGLLIIVYHHFQADRSKLTE
jgi:hypothetical protein